MNAQHGSSPQWIMLILTGQYFPLIFPWWNRTNRNLRSTWQFIQMLLSKSVAFKKTSATRFNEPLEDWTIARSFCLNSHFLTERGWSAASLFLSVDSAQRFHNSCRHILICDDADNSQNILIAKFCFTQQLNILWATGLWGTGHFGCIITNQPLSLG